MEDKHPNLKIDRYEKEYYNIKYIEVIIENKKWYFIQIKNSMVKLLIL